MGVSRRLGTEDWLPLRPGGGETVTMTSLPSPPHRLSTVCLAPGSQHQHLGHFHTSLWFHGPTTEMARCSHTAAHTLLQTPL
uniref:Uncharacterized protein n=1 Tax=Knipowitschia caucasica TaxID=637954 RepID=A0AAV2MH53_KNICA